jgi:hypothetical protein
MERWQEAIPDLEAGLVKYENKPDLHELLANAYEHVGSTELATEHRRVAKSLQEKKTEK